MFGSALAAELDEVEGKSKRDISRKRDAVLARWIPEARSEEATPVKKTKFRDPGRRA